MQYFYEIIKEKEERGFIIEETNMTNDNVKVVGERKRIHVPSLVLMIIGAVFALLLPIVTYPCSIISLIMSISKKLTHITTYAIVINIIALVLALTNSVLGAMLQMGVITL